MTRPSRCRCGHVTLYHADNGCAGWTIQPGHGYYGPCDCTTYTKKGRP